MADNRELESENPSSFWFEREKLMMTVYVDDLLLSGPSAGHNVIWDRLRARDGGGIVVDDPEPLDRFLGRRHVCLEGGGDTPIAPDT